MMEWKIFINDTYKSLRKNYMASFFLFIDEGGHFVLNSAHVYNSGKMIFISELILKI